MCGLDKVGIIYFIGILSIAKGNDYFSDLPNSIKDPAVSWSQPRESRVAFSRSDDIFYICEEPPDTVPPESNRTCNFRNVDYHEQIYRWVAGRGCLYYTPNFLYVGGESTINLNNACLYGHLWAPCLEILKEDDTYACYPFDPGLEEVAAAVRDALVPSAHGRWERCFEEATACCSEYMVPESSKNNYLPEILVEYDDVEEDCGATFDGWTCWLPAPGGTTAVEVCSEFAYSNQGPSCHHYSSKECFRNGTWELQTDYSTCSITTRLIQRYRFYIAMLAFSIISCLPAVVIFLFYKRLRVTRVALHRNLLIAIIIRNVLVIISRSEVYLDELTNSGETAMSIHSVGCRILAILEKIASNVVFVCMLVEGIYLHRIIVTTFRRKLKVKWLYVAGAVIAIVPVIAWSIVMGVLDDHSCWVVYTVNNIQWIVDAPRLAVLVINTALFLDVLRVLLTKIRNSENAHQLSTTKASLFLMPIFGSQFLLTAFRPNTTNCTREQVYYYITYTIEGLQGFVVALLYCYINKEVRMLIKATYVKTENAVVSRVRGESYSRPSLGPNSRRMTYSTNLPSQFEDSKENDEVVPKLHVAEIISINATERLAEILEPVYETVDVGEVNEGYDSSLDKPPTHGKELYSNDYTNASSTSYENEDWIRSVTSHESNPFTSQSELDKVKQDSNKVEDLNKLAENSKAKKQLEFNENDIEQLENECVFEDSLEDTDHDSMFEEIFQYIDLSKEKLKFDPELFSPNRRKEDQIKFVDE